MTLPTQIALGFGAACAVVWLCGAIVLARATIVARRLAIRAQRLTPADLAARLRVAQADALRMKGSAAQLTLVAARARIALASIRRSLAAAQIVFRRLPSPSRNGRAR